MMERHASAANGSCSAVWSVGTTGQCLTCHDAHTGRGFCRCTHPPCGSQLVCPVRCGGRAVDARALQLKRPVTGAVWVTAQARHGR